MFTDVYIFLPILTYSCLFLPGRRPAGRAAGPGRDAWRMQVNAPNYKTSTKLQNKPPTTKQAPKSSVKSTINLASKDTEKQPTKQAPKPARKVVKKKVKKHATDAFRIPFYMNGFTHTHIWDDTKSEEFEDNSINDVYQEAKEPM